MLNRYPLWKNLLILAIVVLGFFYASANLYKPDPAIQLSGVSGSVEITSTVLKRATKVLEKNNIAYTDAGIDEKSGNGLIRLADADQQRDAQDLIKEVLRDNYVVALNLAPTTPEWLRSIGASPMKLGLDLSGGVHFLMEVDTDSVILSHLETNETLIKEQLRDERLRYSSVSISEGKALMVKFRDAELRNKAAGLLRGEYRDFTFESLDENGEFIIRGTMLEARVKEIEDYSVNQNLTTLRNRVNELGVSEPIVQRQGAKRIVVELPGVQDTAEAKRIIGKTANLEFRLEAEPGALASSRESFPYRNEETQSAFGNQWLEKRVVITGESVTRAQVGYDSQAGGSQVNIDLDSDGGAAMYKNTVNNVGRRLGVLFIEYKTKTFDARGNRLEKPEQIIEKRVISLATIQSALNASFRITGLENPAEASELALLLRAGALAAPMQFVQESTIGPSLGAENIKLGVTSVQIGLLLVVLFMLFFYKTFGVAANIALAANLILLVAVMSLLGATLTLPGIAGIVLTVGMAVDANVLIFSRIKEELKNGLSPQYAINSGFDRAFTTILDANLTTLIVAVILYGIGTGPVKGFAVTLAIGILTSMFTAILGTRAIINLIYGGRTVKKLWI